MIERALISVYNKTAVDGLAKGLSELGVELVASGGTAAFLSDQGLTVTRVEELTEVPELLGGRVKTLHPQIHAAILARRDHDEDLATLEAHEIRPFDLVCVNLYPFELVTRKREVREEEAVEMIDIGGPAMLRAAAKNFVHVAPVCSTDRYGSILEELRARGNLEITTRRVLAAEAFAHTAAYEASIASWFADREMFPEQIILSLEKVTDLTYGENPHQRAAYYAEAGVRRHLLSRVDQLSGRELSFNNLGDLDAARTLLREFALPTCVIVKHANPCGVGIAASIEEAYEKALSADPVSAYGGIVAVNRPVELQLAGSLSEQFIEVLIAPEYRGDAVDRLSKKPTTRILVDRERRTQAHGDRDFRRVLGGLLVQDVDSEIDDREGMTVAGSRQPDENGWGDLLFAWRVAKHVGSNAIVIAKDLRTIGIGAGQMSRVDSVRTAIAKARECGHDLQGSTLASDAFFPFPDAPTLATDAGVEAIIQPEGSKRDAEVIAAIDGAGATIVHTQRRHFRH